MVEPTPSGMAAVEQVLTHQRWPGWRGLSAGAIRPGAQGVGVKIDAAKWGGGAADHPGPDGWQRVGRMGMAGQRL